MHELSNDVNFDDICYSFSATKHYFFWDNIGISDILVMKFSHD